MLRISVIFISIISISFGCKLIGENSSFIILHDIQGVRQGGIDVVQQPHQFSWYSDKKPDDIEDHAAFVECLEAAFVAMDQRLQGNTFHGADHIFYRA